MAAVPARIEGAIRERRNDAAKVSSETAAEGVVVRTL